MRDKYSASTFKLTLTVILMQVKMDRNYEIKHQLDLSYLCEEQWKVIFNSDSLLQLATSFCKYLVICGLNSLFSGKLSLKYSSNKVLFYARQHSFSNVKLFTHISLFCNNIYNLMIRWWSKSKISKLFFYPLISPI